MKRCLLLVPVTLALHGGCSSKPSLDQSILTTVTSDIPLPPSSEPFSTKMEQGQPSVSARLSSKEDDVKRFYLNALPQRGWAVEEKTKRAAGRDLYAIFARRNSSRTYRIQIAKGAGMDLEGNEDPNDVMVIIKSVAEPKASNP